MSDLRSYTTATLGIRNNNPGNLRDDGTAWHGRVGSNKGFVVFSSVEYGIRAMAKVIENNIRAGRDTITDYITRYAPPSENDTTAYINSVSDTTGIGANDTLKATPDTLFKLVKAQIRVENGASASLVTDRMIADGINLLGGKVLPPIAGIPIVAILVIGAIFAIVYFSNK